MNHYKHISYNPKMQAISAVIEEAQKESKEWKFIYVQPVTEYEWIAVFEKWIY